MLFTIELIFILSEPHFIRFLLELILSFLSHLWNINFNSISIHRALGSTDLPDDNHGGDDDEDDGHDGGEGDDEDLSPGEDWLPLLTAC